MKLETAAFCFSHPKYVVHVAFDGDEVAISWGVQWKVIQNKPAKDGNRPYKPCVTHAVLLAQQAMPKPPKRTEHARQRAGRVRPGLCWPKTRVLRSQNP